MIEEQSLIRGEISVQYLNPSESCLKHRILLKKSILDGRYCQICKEETQGKDALTLLLDLCREVHSCHLSRSALEEPEVIRSDRVEIIPVDFMSLNFANRDGWYARYLEREWCVELLGHSNENPFAFAHKLSLPDRRGGIPINVFLASVWVLHKRLEREEKQASRLTIHLQHRKISKREYEEFRARDTDQKTVNEILSGEEFRCRFSLYYLKLKFGFYLVAWSIGQETFTIRV